MELWFPQRSIAPAREEVMRKVGFDACAIPSLGSIIGPASRMLLTFRRAIFTGYRILLAHVSAALRRAARRRWGRWGFLAKRGRAGGVPRVPVERRSALSLEEARKESSRPCTARHRHVRSHRAPACQPCRRATRLCSP